MSIPEGLQKIFNKALNHRKEPPTLQLDMLLDDLEVDDIDRMEIAMGIEEDFPDCMISDETITGWTSVAEIVALYEALEEEGD